MPGCPFCRNRGAYGFAASTGAPCGARKQINGNTTWIRRSAQKLERAVQSDTAYASSPAGGTGMQDIACEAAVFCFLFFGCSIAEHLHVGCLPVLLHGRRVQLLRRRLPLRRRPCTHTGCNQITIRLLRTVLTKLLSAACTLRANHKPTPTRQHLPPITKVGPGTAQDFCRREGHAPPGPYCDA